MASHRARRTRQQRLARHRAGQHAPTLWLDDDGAAGREPLVDLDRRSSHGQPDQRGRRRAGPDHLGYGLQLTTAPTLQAAARPQPPRVAGDLRMAALNLENLFNGDGRGGGFPTPRGARTPAELAAQLAKHVATLRGLDADIVALMELENDGYGPDSSLAALLVALNAGGGDWRAVDAGQGPGDNPIRVGLIYRAGRVRPQGTAGDAGRRPVRRAQPRAAGAGVRTGEAAVATTVRPWSWSPITSSPRAAAARKAPTATSAMARPAGTTLAPARRASWTPGSGPTRPFWQRSDLDRRRSECLRPGRPPCAHWSTPAGGTPSMSPASVDPYSYVYDGQPAGSTTPC